MPRRRTYAPLAVFINARRVGTLERQSTGAIAFRYAPDWLAWAHAFPVSLSLPLREDRYLGAPVVNVFDNLLPDHEPIRRRVAERTAAGGTDAYSLLAAIGHDCVGALQFLPEDADPGPAGAIVATPIPDADIAELIDNLANAPLGLGRDEEFRISIAGAQEKTALLRLEGRWHKPNGTTATTHILKPRIGRLPNGIDLSDSVENEFLCLRLLAALGVPTADAQIVDFENHRVLVVERFDRLWTRDGRLLRRPQEDACQALSVPPTRKYQSDGGPGMRDILALLASSDAPAEDIATFLRATIAFWLLGATDGHAKNVSIAQTQGGGFRLAPLYDVLTAQPSLDAGLIERKAFRLAMSVGRNRHYAIADILPRHFQQTADQSGVAAASITAILEDLADTAIARADAVVETLPAAFPERLVASVRAAIAARTDLLARASTTA